jgi:hypothetical protein
MKVFISQPMNGKTQDEILAARAPVVQHFESEGYEVIDNVTSSFEPTGDPASFELQYLAENIRVLSNADVVFFMPGWECYHGCRMEHMLCDEYNKNAYVTENNYIVVFRASDNYDAMIQDSDVSSETIEAPVAEQGEEDE